MRESRRERTVWLSKWWRRCSRPGVRDSRPRGLAERRRLPVTAVQRGGRWPSHPVDDRGTLMEKVGNVGVTEPARFDHTGRRFTQYPSSEARSSCVLHRVSFAAVSTPWTLDVRPFSDRSALNLTLHGPWHQSLEKTVGGPWRPWHRLTVYRSEQLCSEAAGPNSSLEAFELASRAQHSQAPLLECESGGGVDNTRETY